MAMSNINQHKNIINTEDTNIINYLERILQQQEAIFNRKLENIQKQHKKMEKIIIQQQQQIKTLSDIQGQQRHDLVFTANLDAVLRNNKFFRNVIVDIPKNMEPIMLPSSEEIDINQYPLIKTLICYSYDFITNTDLIKQLPNIKTLYLFSQDSTSIVDENTFNTIDLRIKALYIINGGVPNYSRLPNLEFLYLYCLGIRPSYHNFVHLENIKTLYLVNTQWSHEYNDISCDLTHLRTLKTLYIDNVDNPYRINLSNLNSLTTLTVKGHDIRNIDFNCLYNIENLEISQSTVHNNSSLSFLLKRLNHLITLKYRWITVERGNGDELRGVTLKYLNCGNIVQTRQQMLDLGINIRT